MTGKGSKTSGRRFPVVDPPFGPVVQGEGALMGHPTYFVRLGGCDYACSWCDTKYAVIPQLIQENRVMMTVEEIVQALRALRGHPRWVTLSGGNPALHPLGELVDALHTQGWKVAVETQGTVCPAWLNQCDVVTVSPKPPSSAMVTDWVKLDAFTGLTARWVLKIVCFDDADLAYAEGVRERYPAIPFFLQVGNTVGEDTPLDLLAKYRWLSEAAMERVLLGDAVVLPQLHVLNYGNERAK